MRKRIVALLIAIMLLVGGVVAQAAESELNDGTASRIAYDLLVGFGNPADYIGKTDPDSLRIAGHYHSLGVNIFNEAYTTQMRELGLTPYTKENVPPLPENNSYIPELGDSSTDLTLLIAMAVVALCGAVYAHKKLVRL